MAQPQLIKYSGSINIKKNVPFTADGFSVSINLMQMKTSGVSVSVNGTNKFLTKYDDISYIDRTAVYVFSKDCVIAYGELTN